MATYVRFETPYRCESSQQPLGIFWAIAQVEDRSDLAEWKREWLIDRGYWFGKHLPAPRMRDFDQRAIFWFRPCATIVREIWHLVAALREEGVMVQRRWTRMPGRVVYEDDFQIAAIPFSHGRRNRRNRLPQLI